jgi:hypothetical protein
MFRLIIILVFSINLIYFTIEIPKSHCDETIIN